MSEDRTHLGADRAGGGIRRLFLVCFPLLFGLLFLAALFVNPHFNYSVPGTLAMTAFWLLLFILWRRFCVRGGAFLIRRERTALLIFWLLLVITQFFFYSQLAVYPTRDFERVYTGAVNFAVNGFIEEPYLDYFYKFPNNMPATILLQLVFRLFNRVGLRDFYVIGVVVGALCVQLSFLFLYLVARRLFGVPGGFLALGMLLVCLPLHCYIGVFYTDILSMPFVAFGFWAGLRLRDATGWKGRLLWGWLLGLGVALGTKIRYSVVILLVALLIDLALRRNWRALLSGTLAFALCFAVVSTVFDGYMYAHFLDREIARDKATPMAAWVMMGLKGDGAHNADDNHIVWNMPTREEKQQLVQWEISERLSAFTPGGFVAFLAQKAMRSFGSGNFSYTTLVADSPQNQTLLVECVSENGRYYEVFSAIVQGAYLAVLGCIAAGALRCAQRRDWRVFTAQLSIFGLFLFLLLWEASQRYLLHYYSLFIVAALPALLLWDRPLKEMLGRAKEEKSAQEEQKEEPVQ